MEHPRRKAAAAGLAVLLLSSCGGGGDNDSGGGGNGDGSLEGQRLVFVNYGGLGLEAAQAGWLDPFSEETGVQFATDSPSDVARVQAMVEAGQTTWDVVDLDPGVGAANCGVLFEERPDDFDMSQVDERYVSDDCGVPIIVQASTLVYNADLFGDDPPTQMSDFLDTERFPGKRMYFNSPTGSVEPLLAADGVEPDQMFPIDWARVERINNDLGSDLVVQPTLAQMGSAVESGDFAMCLCYTGRIASAIENGANVGIVWDRTWLGWDMAYAVKGSQAPEAQWAFLQWLATPASVGFYEELPYSPATLDTEPDVSEEYKSVIPIYNEDQINVTYEFNVPWWSENAEEAYAEWNRVVSG
ncbi:extracellular solute-binding protein [Blastococcus sp. SYSU D00695]